MHGKTSTISHDSAGVFAGLPQGIEVMRYHSLVAERSTLPACLSITAETGEGDIMGLRHRERRIEGIQFHPESFATEGGKQMLTNFIQSLS
jgi:anthranilate/para-aminobenzoate synthase component II